VLKDLFTGLTDDQTPDDRRRDLILFLKELCAFAQNLQPQARESFYKVSLFKFYLFLSFIGKWNRILTVSLERNSNRFI
jgi:hypothetical protein